jgi:hypothetical protein
VDPAEIATAPVYPSDPEGPPGTPTVPRPRVVLAVGRHQEVRLLTALQADARQRLVARVTSAADLVRLVEEGQADVAVLDEDLHALSQESLDVLADRRLPFVFLARDPDAAGWRVQGGLVLPAGSEPGAIVEALSRALRGEGRPRRATRARIRSAGGLA